MEKQIEQGQNNQQHVVIINSKSNETKNLTLKIKSFIRKVKSIFAMGVLIAAISSCEEEVLNPTTGSSMECETNNWAYVYFENLSESNTTYDVIWDGSRIVRNLAPGERTEKFIFSATNHSYSFKIANTNTLACSSAYPGLAQCTSNTFSCSY